MSLTINQGENAVIRRSLKYADGTTDLKLTDLALAIVRLKKFYPPYSKEYAYPSGNLRQGQSTSQLELEIAEAVSAELPGGDIEIEIELRSPSPDFQSEDIKDIIREEFTVTDEPTAGSHVDTATVVTAINFSVWGASGSWGASSGVVGASSG